MPAITGRYCGSGRHRVPVDEQDYSGDSFVLYDRGIGRWATLVFGCGSCSGCDALQAAMGSIGMMAVAVAVLFVGYFIA